MYTTTYRREKDWSEIGLGCLGLITLAAILVVVSAFITTLVWGWIVPQVFASAVDKGILPASLTIIQALKLSILFSILGLTGASSAKASTKSSSSSSFGETIAVALIAFVIMLPIIAVLAVVSGFFVSIVWGWVIPDVFAGAVAQGILPASLGLGQAIMLSILFSVLGLSSHRSKSSSKD